MTEELTGDGRDDFPDLAELVSGRQGRQGPLTWSLYRMVVLPAESNPTINILTSLSFPQNARDESELYMRESERPICAGTSTMGQ